MCYRVSWASVDQIESYSPVLGDSSGGNQVFTGCVPVPGGSLTKLGYPWVGRSDENPSAPASRRSVAARAIPVSPEPANRTGAVSTWPRPRLRIGASVPDRVCPYSPRQSPWQLIYSSVFGPVSGQPHDLTQYSEDIAKCELTFIYIWGGVSAPPNFHFPHFLTIQISTFHLF